MASWKKVVVSGSNASLAAISASNGLHVTGSILTSGSNDFDAVTLFRKPVQVQAYTGNALALGTSNAALTTRSSGSAYALNIGNTTNVAGSTGGGLYIQSGQYQTQPIINHFTYNGQNPFKVETSGNITSQGSLSIAGNITGSGNTVLGNASSDILKVTGSAKFDIQDQEFLIQNGSEPIDFLKIDGNNQIIRIDSGNAGVNTRFNTNNAVGGAIISFGAEVGMASSLDVGVGQTIADRGLFVTGSSRFTGSVVIDGTLTVTNDTLQEDLQTTGTTKLGNDMSDKTEVTGSLNVTGSSIFDGPNATVTIDPSSTTVLNIKDNGGSSIEALKLVKSNGTEMISLNNQGSEATFKMTDNGGNSISLSSKQATNSFHLPNFAIGANSTDANNTLSVTGNANITNGLRVSGSTALLVTGSSHLTGSVHIVAHDGVSNHRGIQVNIAQEGITNDSDDSVVLRPGPLGSAGAANLVMLPSSDQGNYIVNKLGTTGSSRYGYLKIRGNNLDDIFFQASDNGASYHKGSLNIGGTSTTVGPKLDVTGNIRVSTGITGSYLTADRIPFVNAQKGLIDSSNLVYDDDGGFNTGAKLTLTGDLFVSHNLTVQGTASFQHTEDLDVADRFIRMASGSTSNGDGGIAVQQTSPTDTEGFGYDSATSRWGVTSSFDASQNALAPAAFMPVAINGTDNNPTSNSVANETRYKKAGNIYIDTNATMEEGGVWIYV